MIKHMIQQPFIFATGLAALIHSTWSLGTIFAGKQPDHILTVEGIGWLLPALLIAFALDVGQIATSAEIRAGERTKTKYATFIIFAVATYYLQWLYIAHHMPNLPLAAGVRADWAEHITVLRDLGIWIVPGLLPLSTTLYTISQQDKPQKDETIDIETPLTGQLLEELPDNTSSISALPEPLEDDTEPYEPIDTENEHNLVCEHCGWETGPRLRLESSERALRTHQSRHCVALESGE